MSDLPTALLCLPGPGDRTVARLRRKVELVALRRLLILSGDGLSARQAGCLRAIQARVQEMARRHPDAVMAAIGSPDVWAPLLVLESGLRPEVDVLPNLVPALLVGLARDREALAEALLWEAPVAAVPDAWTQQRTRFDPPAKAMLVDPAGVAIERADGTRLDLPTTPEAAGVDVQSTGSALGAPDLGLCLSLHDSNPISMDEAHPDKSGNAVSLGNRSISEWREALEAALGLIAVALPEWHAEMAVSLDRIVPVGFEPEMHLSASYREAPGTVYMTLHPDPVTMAEAIIHETQHGKLNLLSHLDPVLHNGYTDWSESPVRPDLRPLMGVLLAVHAFIPVAALHQSLVDLNHPLTHTRRFKDRQRQVLSGNAGGLAVLHERAQASTMGARVLAGLDRLHTHLTQALEPLDTDQLPPG